MESIKAGCFRLMPLTFGFPLFSEAIQVAYSIRWSLDVAAASDAMDWRAPAFQSSTECIAYWVHCHLNRVTCLIWVRRMAGTVFI